MGYFSTFSKHILINSQWLPIIKGLCRLPRRREEVCPGGLAEASVQFAAMETLGPNGSISQPHASQSGLVYVT